MKEPERVDDDTLAAVQQELDQAHAEAMELLRSKGTRGQFILLVSAQDEDGDWGARMIAGGSSERYDPADFDGDEQAQKAMEAEVLGFLEAAVGAVLEIAIEAGAIPFTPMNDEEEEQHGDDPE